MASGRRVLMVTLAHASLHSVLQAEPPARWSDLPEDLLVSVFSTLRHPRDLLACACVCKAWQAGQAQAFEPVLFLMDGLHDDLRRLVTLTPIQRAAVRDVKLLFCKDGPQATPASAMILAFISNSLPRLQRLHLDWSLPSELDEKDRSQVGCRADA